MCPDANRERKCLLPGLQMHGPGAANYSEGGDPGGPSTMHYDASWICRHLSQSMGPPGRILSIPPGVWRPEQATEQVSNETTD